MNEQELQILTTPDSDESIALVLKQWCSQGFAPDQPLGKYRSFVEAWLDQAHQGWFASLGVKSLEVLWSDKIVQILKEPNHGQRGENTHKTNWEVLLDGLSYKLEGRSVNSHPAETRELLRWLLPKIPTKIVTKWQDRDGQGLLARLIKTENCDKLVEQWIELGLPVVKQNVYEAKQAVVLQAFIQQGGNLQETAGEGETMWQRLYVFNPSLKEELAQIIEQQYPQEWGQFKHRKFFEKLERNYTVADLKRAMAQLPNWEKLTNEEGINPLKLAYLQNQKLISFDEKMPKKYLGLLKQEDNKGRNFWFQFLTKGKDINLQSLQWCLDNLAIKSSSGEGWLSWLGEMKSPHESFLNAVNKLTGQSLLKAVPPEVWLPVGEIQEKQVAKFMWQGIGFLESRGWAGQGQSLWRRTTKSSQWLANCYEQLPQAGPNLKRVFAICRLLENSFGQGGTGTNHQKNDTKTIQELSDAVTANGWHLELINNVTYYGKNNQHDLSEFLQNKYPDIYAKLVINQKRAELEKTVPETEKSKNAMRI